MILVLVMIHECDFVIIFKKLTIGNFMTFHADSLASIFLKMRHKEHKETTKCELRIKLHFHDDASSIFFFFHIRISVRICL